VTINSVRFKLDLLAPQNGFVAHNAHDALGDVKATIHLARLIAQRPPELWEEILSNRDKAAVQTRLASFKPMALVERFGGGPPRATIGCFCGTSASNTSQAAFFDLDEEAHYLRSSQLLAFARLRTGIAISKAVPSICFDALAPPTEAVDACIVDQPRAGPVRRQNRIIGFEGFLPCLAFNIRAMQHCKKMWCNLFGTKDHFDHTETGGKKLKDFMSIVPGRGVVAVGGLGIANQFTLEPCLAAVCGGHGVGGKGGHVHGILL
jgi:hypothetical protein